MLLRCWRCSFNPLRTAYLQLRMLMGNVKRARLVWPVEDCTIAAAGRSSLVAYCAFGCKSTCLSTCSSLVLT